MARQEDNSSNPRTLIEPDIDVSIQHTIEAYNQLAYRYARKWDSFRNDDAMTGFRDLICGKSPLVLDLACGTGRDLRLLIDLGINAFGVDLSKAMLEQTRFQQVHDRICLADMRRLPYADEQFDAVWASACFLHFPHAAISTALLELARIVKQVVFISVVEGEGHSWAKAPNNTKRFFAYYSKQELSDLLKQAGFLVLEIWNPHPPDVHPRWLYTFARKLKTAAM